MKERRQASPHDSQRDSSDWSHDAQRGSDQSEEARELQEEDRSTSVQLESSSRVSELQVAQDRPADPPSAPTHIDISQPIGSLRGVAGVGSGGPLTLTGTIEMITDEEIMKNREPDEGIRSIPRFRDYQPGEPSKVPPAAFPQTS